MQQLLGALLMVGALITGFVLLIVFVAVPVFKGVGAGIGAIFRGVGWFFAHIFEFVGGTLSDVVRFIGGILVWIVLMFLVPVNVVLGRWSAAGHYAQAVKRECQIGSACLYRIVLRRPLKLLMLHGLLEGFEQRLPEALNAAPGADNPSRRTGQFDGYTILGSLRGGGSGAKLYVAEPSEHKRRSMRGIAMPDRVVIKSFALTEGSSLPQIVRESRALECARKLGHVVDHGMDAHRFFYVMPYHPGDNLSIVTRHLHGESEGGLGGRLGGRVDGQVGGGLGRRQVQQVMAHTRDLLETLSCYHDGGLWHKDVKPENIIVHDGKAHLVDLGLITSLRSAMTLTTHGTEYFRDPEMVRQALRGVKVHEVNGAKFDIYAAGAVLYFMLENTFPANGGLSRFVNNSPEALRWIVRRAMTDYNQRYESADAMLADVEAVAQAGDPFAVKPADLPSMRGANVHRGGVHVVNATGMSDADAWDAVKAGRAKAYAAAVPADGRPTTFQGFGVFAGKDENGTFAQVGRINIGPDGRPIPPANPSGFLRKPRLCIMNWWTGRYAVEKAAQGGAQGAAKAAVGASDSSPGGTQPWSDFRAQAAAMRHQANQMRSAVQAGTISARKAAREQIKAARARAAELRTRAMTRRHVALADRQPSPAVVVLTLASLAVVAAAGYGGYRVMRGVASDQSAHWRFTHNDQGLPVLLVVDAFDPAHPKAMEEIDQVVQRKRREGYDVIVDSSADANKIRSLLHDWQRDQHGPADAALENIFAAENLYGLLYVEVEGDARRPARRVNGSIITSSHPEAERRRRPAFDVPAPPKIATPYLLINDHPAKIDPTVAARIETIVKAYRDKGWQLHSNDDLEVEMRRVIPLELVQPLQEQPKWWHGDPIVAPPAVNAVLVSANLGGVLFITSKPGESSAYRVHVTQIIRDQTARTTDEGGNTSAENG